MTRHRRHRGFTLVELMVSLVAGLIVSIAVVGLAKTATRTFYEQARTAIAQQSTRATSERLRNDLLRASFMSTGNIATDPKIARTVGATTGSRYAGTTNLQGVYIEVGGSPVKGNVLENTANGLAPDRITLGGNFTGDDAFIGNWVDPNGTNPKLGGCGASEIQMDPAGDAAVYRAITQAATPDVAAKQLFTPDPAKTFIARIQDARGCFHYVQVCEAGYKSNRAYVDINNDSSAKSILTTSDTGNDNCGARVGEQVTIAPVQRVRWSIVANASTIALDLDTSVSPNDEKYNLVRETLDASNAAGVPVTTLTQVMAEWAVDLKFGLVIQDINANTLSIADIDTDPDGSGTIGKTAGLVPVVNPGPQDIRAIRYRLSLRTELPDRTNGLPTVFPPPYLVRYCADKTAPGFAACKSFARVRTIVSEVTLTNQAAMFY